MANEKKIPNGVDVDGSKIINLGTPTALLDGVNKSYVDALTFSTIVIIKTLSDLPAVSGGKYTLVAGKLYWIDVAVLNLGTNYIDANGAMIRGNSSLSTTVVYSGTGAAIRGTNVSGSFSFFAISAPKAFDFTNTARDKYLSFQNLGIASQTSASTFVGYKTILCNIINCLGNIGVFVFTDNGFVIMNLNNIDSTNTGTFITINPQTYTKISLFSSDLVVQTGSVGVNVTSTNISYGQIKGCSFSGTATVANRLTGVNGGTPSWNIGFGANDGISGLQFVDVDVTSTADAAFANGAGTYTEPTTVRGYIYSMSEYDPYATIMQGKVIALITSVEATIQIGVRNLTAGTNDGGLKTAIVPSTLGYVDSDYVTVTPNRMYQAYYVKTVNAGANIVTRFGLKMKLKIY